MIGDVMRNLQDLRILPAARVLQEGTDIVPSARHVLAVVVPPVDVDAVDGID
jgi:hypothetical protein